MMLEEAIKIIQQLRVKHWDDFSNSELHASSIGIEALKREQWNRLHPSYPDKGLLPGETYIPENVGILPSDIPERMAKEVGNERD